MRTAHWIALTLAALPLPAAAQDAAAPAPEAGTAAGAVETYRKRTTVVVYGNDPCPAAQSPDEIVVCARRPEEERYRIGRADRVPGERPAELGGTARTLGTDDVRLAGGTGSCSPVGPGGVHGCSKGIDLLGLGAWLNSLVTD
jgi:hypothetical protein